MENKENDKEEGSTRNIDFNWDGVFAKTSTICLKDVTTCYKDDIQD